MKNILNLIFALFISTTVFSQSNIEKDRKAIKSMSGFYEVSFNYVETFASKNTYEFKPRYESHGSEWVLILEDTPTKIVMQHILVLGKNMVMKHWREDWIYEAPTLLKYEKDNKWIKTKASNDEVKGTWVQKVYQVDDSPRYEGRGTWTHVDGKSRWESETDSPLPRREHSKRNDYNVLKRLNRLYSTETGWMFEQDNQKIIRDNGKDILLVREKGLEEFNKIDEKIFDVAKVWWKEQAPFWKVVRNIWEKIYEQNEVIQFQNTINSKALYDHLFPLAQTSIDNKWGEERINKEVFTIIHTYLKEK